MYVGLKFKRFLYRKINIFVFCYNFKNELLMILKIGGYRMIIKFFLFKFV